MYGSYCHVDFRVTEKYVHLRYSDFVPVSPIFKTHMENLIWEAWFLKKAFVLGYIYSQHGIDQFLGYIYICIEYNTCRMPIVYATRMTSVVSSIFQRTINQVHGAIDSIRCPEWTEWSPEYADESRGVGSAERWPTTERGGAPFDWSLQEQA